MSSFFKTLFKVFKRLLLPALPAVAIVLSGGCSSNCADNTIDVGEQSEIIILGEGRINSDMELYPGDSVKVTYVIEISDYDGTARFTAALVSDASDFSAECFTVSWLIAGEGRDTVSVADNGESIVVTVIMNDSSAGEGRFYSSPPLLIGASCLADGIKVHNYWLKGLSNDETLNFIGGVSQTCFSFIFFKFAVPVCSFLSICP